MTERNVLGEAPAGLQDHAVDVPADPGALG
jgi:hypothetical protein